MPVPRRLDHIFKIFKSRLPPQFLSNFSSVGNQNRRISRPGIAFNSWNLMPGNPAGRFDYLPDGISPAVSEIINTAVLARQKCIQCQQMGLRQIADVDVVADAGAVGRRIRLPPLKLRE